MSFVYAEPCEILGKRRTAASNMATFALSSSFSFCAAASWRRHLQVNGRSNHYTENLAYLLSEGMTILHHGFVGQPVSYCLELCFGG